MSLHSRETPSRTFGDGALNIERQPDGTLAFQGGLYGVAFSHGCPVPDRVAHDFGVEWAISRYASCNLMFRHVILPEAALKADQTLLHRLSEGGAREQEEQPQRFDPQHVPPGYEERFIGMCSPWGYSAPRIMIEQLGEFESIEQREAIDPDGRLYNVALAVLAHALRSTDDPLVFVVRLAEGMANENADPTAILSHLLAADFYVDENAASVVARLKVLLEQEAPVLWRHYQSLTPAARAGAGIIT